MWKFEHMGEAAFQAYTALPNVSPVEKISMRQKYDFPRKHLADVYIEICKRDHPLSVEEGKQIGVEALALISQTREELKKKWRHWRKETREQVVVHNLIELKPSFTLKMK
jgi:hypothetical protein